MFHPFSRLPPELRLSIWELTIVPRLVRITTRVQSGPKSDEVLYVKTNTPCPTVMQVCRESRSNVKYLRAFTWGTNPRYTWINFAYDMIACSSEDYLFYEFGEDNRNIRRIRLTTNDERPWDWYSEYDLEGTAPHMERELHSPLPSLQEAHIVNRGVQLNVDFHGPDFWPSISLTVSSIQSVDPMMGTVVIDPKQYGRGGESAKNQFSYDNNDRDGSEKDIEVIRKMVHDATPSSERHLVRCRSAKTALRLRNGNVQIVADVCPGRAITTDAY